MCSLGSFYRTGLWTAPDQLLWLFLLCLQHDRHLATENPYVSFILINSGMPDHLSAATSLLLQRPPTFSGWLRYNKLPEGSPHSLSVGLEVSSSSFCLGRDGGTHSITVLSKTSPPDQNLRDELGKTLKKSSSFIDVSTNFIFNTSGVPLAPSHSQFFKKV